MTTENTTAPDAAQASEQAVQAEQKQTDPSVSTGDNAEQVAESKPAQTGDDESSRHEQTVRSLQRSISRRTAAAAAANERASAAIARVRELEARLAQPEGDEPQQREAPRADDIERMATERAREIAYGDRIAAKAQAALKAGQGIDGFDAATQSLAEELPLLDARGKPTPAAEALLDSEHAAKLIHYLGTHPDEAAELAELSPAALGRRLAKLEDRLVGEAKKTVSNAPRPLKVVTPGASSDGPSDSDSMADWTRKEAARLNAQRGRPASTT